MKVQLRKAVEEATMSYTFCFSKGYHWTLGGKLPGLSCACASTYSSVSHVVLLIIVLLLIQPTDMFMDSGADLLAI